MKALTTVAFSIALVGIIANAVLFQKGHRPASPSDIASGTPTSPAAAAAPDGRPTGAVPPPAAETPAPAAPDAAASPSADGAPQRRRTAAPHHGTDTIGRLLRGQSPAPGDDRAGAKAKLPKTDLVLLQVQRQLKKLGYGVTADGRMDGGTREAIKRFAHDHHVKDEAKLTVALRREIAAALSAPPPAGSKPAAPPKVQ